jgi:Flp pilus assembly protein CpaB
VRLRPEADGLSPGRVGRRRWAQPLPLAGGLLVLVALLGYWSVYSQTTKRTQVLVAEHALAPGHVLAAGDLRAAGLAGDKSVLAALVRAREESSVVGRTLKTAIGRGAPLARAALASPGRQAASFTLAVPLLHALAGELRPGDRVTVLATYTDPGGRAQTRAIGRDLDVIAVGSASGFTAGAQAIPVTVALPDPSLASALALANEAGKLDLLRQGARGQTAPIPAERVPAGSP